MKVGRKFLNKFTPSTPKKTPKITLGNLFNTIPIVETLPLSNEMDADKIHCV
jgi:hypothetical protein